MFAFHTTLVLLHILTAAAWFGLGLRVAAPLRLLAPGLQGAPADAIIAGGAGTARLMTIFAALTAIFAAGAFFTGGGFARYGPAYHASILLILVLLGVQILLIQKPWSALAAGVTDAASARKRIAAGTGVGHLLWVVLLFLMFWDNYQGVALR